MLHPKFFVFSILHPNPSIHRLEAGGVELVAGQITIQNRGFGWERAGSGVPCATLASLSQLWADWSVWMLPGVCSVFPDPIHPSWGRYLPATTFNAASCRPLDGGVRVEYGKKQKFLVAAFIEFLRVLNFQYSTKIIKLRELVHKCIVFYPFPQFRGTEVYAWTHIRFCFHKHFCFCCF